MTTPTFTESAVILIGCGLAFGAILGALELAVMAIEEIRGKPL